MLGRVWVWWYAAEGWGTAGLGEWASPAGGEEH